MEELENRISTKENLHPNNKHRKAYDFKKLGKANPELNDFVRRNEYGDLSINFSDNMAVLALNKAILISDYGVKDWGIPENYLCPPIPGRAEYIHHIAELLEKETGSNKDIKCLDIGVGANCIYPIVGAVDYEWTFVASDIDKVAIESAQKILDKNPNLKSKIELRLQDNSQNYFKGIIKDGETFDVSICNPPFFTSQKDYEEANLQKTQNLTNDKAAESNSNFGGQEGELWCLGGEKRFIKAMIKESKKYAKSVKWFTCLVSKNDNLKQINKSLEKHKAADIKVIEMTVGHKISRFVAWKF